MNRVLGVTLATHCVKELPFSFSPRPVDQFFPEQDLLNCKYTSRS